MFYYIIIGLWIAFAISVGVLIWLAWERPRDYD